MMVRSGHCCPSSTHDQNVPTGGSFLDILRSGFVDTRNCTSGLNNYYYGFSSAAAAAANGGLEVGNVMSTGDHQAAGVLSSEGGGGGSCKDMDHEGDDSTKVLMGFPWQVQQQAAGDHHHHGSAGMSAVEFAGRDYWAAAAGVAANSSWHGLINNPLM